MFKLHNIWSVISQVSHWNLCHQMPWFWLKTYRPRWGSLQRSPRPSGWIEGVLLAPNFVPRFGG